MTIPFCYAIAGFWRKEYKEWILMAMPWGLFATAILGTGILMGGAWAYEALSFGGYWSWDPVENGVLVPWLILVAGLHANLIAKHTGHANKMTFALYSLAFFLTLYSTFLTRSGVLGETSAHAFTELGLEWQLVIFMLFFLAFSLFWYIRRYKDVPKPQREEQIYSREFWMFIGSLILVFFRSINHIYHLYSCLEYNCRRHWKCLEC